MNLSVVDDATHLDDGAGLLREGGQAHLCMIPTADLFSGAVTFLDQATATVFMFVLGNALGESATASLTRRLNREGGNAEELMRDTMAQASEIAMQFPRLRARLEATAAPDYGAAPDNSFEFGLQTIFDGLEDQLATRRTRAL